MSDKDLIARLWREAAYVKPLSKGAYEALTDAADALEAATSERDAALAAIERVRAIHERDMVLHDYCSECSDFGSDQFPPGRMVEWPCPTIAAIDGGEWLEGIDPMTERERMEEAMTTDNRTNVQIVADALRSMPEAERDDDRDPAVVVAEYAVAALVAAQGAEPQTAKDIHEPNHDRVYCVRCGGNWPCQPAPQAESDPYREETK